jgi:hypothetical protein
MFEYRASPPIYDYACEREWTTRMGDVAGKEFSHMVHEHDRLTYVYTELLVLYRYLIECPPERRHILYSFTSMVRDAFWKDVLIGLCKDGVHAYGKSPVSLVSWRARYARGIPKAGKAEVQACVEAVFGALVPIKELRNTHLAHSDGVALAAGEPNGVSLEQVATALGALSDCFRTFERLHDVPQMPQLPEWSWLGGAVSFISLLKSAPSDYL